MDGTLGYNFVAVASRISRNENLVDKGNGSIGSRWKKRSESVNLIIRG